MYPPNIYLFKVNNRNTRKRCEACLKLTIKTAERPHDSCLKSLNTPLHSFFIYCFQIINAERERRKKLREAETVKTEENNRTRHEAEETWKLAVSEGKEEKHEDECVLGTRTEESSLETVSGNER